MKWSLHWWLDRLNDLCFLAMFILWLNTRKKYRKEIEFLQDQIRRYDIQLDEDEHERENLEKELGDEETSNEL